VPLVNDSAGLRPEDARRGNGEHLHRTHRTRPGRRRVEGRAQGEAHGRAGAILLLLSQRNVTVPDDARDRITDCQDLTILDIWFTRAITATTVEEIFKED
jgi:hypothetical protein